MTTELARRFPADLGFRTRHDIPTTTDITSYALGAYMSGAITAASLADILTDCALYSDTAHWNALAPHNRALLMADVMGQCHRLVNIESAQRL